MIGLKDHQKQEMEGKLQFHAFLMFMECTFTSLKIPKGTLEQSELFRLLHAFNADTQMDKDQQCTSVFYLVQIWFSECNWALGTLIY